MQLFLKRFVLPPVAIESLVVLILMSLSSLMVVFLPVDGEADGENETL